MRFKIFTVIIFSILIYSCSSARYVPEGEYWLENASIKIDTRKVSYFDLEPYIQQKPNYKTFSLFRLPLFIYNLSGRDTTRWINRVLKNGGEAPVIYDSTKVDKTVSDLTRLMSNKGYVHAKVTPEIKKKHDRVNVIYKIQVGEPYRISEYSASISDSVFENKPSSFLFPNRKNNNTQDSVRSLDLNKLLLRNSLVKTNSIMDLDLLDEERERVSSAFRRLGYYKFDKEYVNYVADTSDISENKVKLDIEIQPYLERLNDGQISSGLHKQYVVKEVDFYVDYNPLEDGDVDEYEYSNVVYRGNDSYKIYYGVRGRYIKPHIILNSCYIVPGQLYSETATTMTYNSFSQLHILKNVNIRYQEIIENDSTKLRCIITCVPDQKQGVAVELEGTNSRGQFGVGAAIGYTHRNLFRGSELFNVKLHGAYEAITPRFSDFENNYFEIGGETSITFPRFMFPFLNRELRKKLQASTQLSGNYTYQRRPSFFSRTILSSQFSYLWNNRRNNQIRHTLDLLDVSYVHIPYLNDNKLKLTTAAKEFSFTDQFILGMGYSYSHSNYNPVSLAGGKRKLTKLYSFRARVETAGNLLSIVAALTDAKKDSLGTKKIFGTRFVQYVLGNVDYSQTIPIDEKNSIAWRVGGGIVFPYGNYRMVPIQKRFFSGGANSVRGWGIRELGPGSFYKRGANFYDQSGEIRFDANIEYRSKVFWKLELAAFLDAGNIWTIKKYKEQQKGNFIPKTFYKEIASAWGLGFRLDFDYVLIRLDCGWKLYDPADIPKRYTMDNEWNVVPDLSAGYKSKWRVTRPFDFKNNTAWHIAVGYPF